MRTTAVLLAGALVLQLGGLARAEPAPGAGGQRLYDPKTVETVSGQVKTVKQVQRGRNLGRAVQLTLETGKGDRLVHLGPAWYLQDKKFAPKAGERLDVTGSRVTIAGETAILAAVVKRGDTVLTLRDDSGTPAWKQDARRR